MRTNLLKAKLEQGKAAIGALVNADAPEMVELFGAIGYDFVFIDGEHGPMNVDQVENMVRAAEASDITPLARTPDHADSTILRFLDRDVQGVIVPHVNTAEQAEAIAKAARYYPEGHRGAGGGRPSALRFSMSQEDARRFVNDNVLVIPMIEEVEAIENLDAIANVPGVDMLHIAAGDLSQSMGYPGQEEVWRVMEDAVRRVRAAGKYASVGGNNPSNPQRVADFFKVGANAITISAMGLMRIAADDFRENVEAMSK
jgi:4-hydroxy-2-oxoheptanedioate aldolase